MKVGDKVECIDNEWLKHHDWLLPYVPEIGETMEVIKVDGLAIYTDKCPDYCYPSILFKLC